MDERPGNCEVTWKNSRKKTLNLIQKNENKMTMAEYEAKCMQLSHFAQELVADEEQRCRCFQGETAL